MSDTVIRVENLGKKYIMGQMLGADRLMNESIFLGTYPGFGKVEIDFVCQTIKDFANSFIIQNT